MNYTQGHPGRIFIVRLEDGDIIPECLEQFAADHKIRCAQVVLLGSLADGHIVVGPEDSVTMPPVPLTLPVNDACETAGVGLIAPDEEGNPVLHLHAALGRAGHTITGCTRPGLKTWLVGEVIIWEILDSEAIRKKDSTSGFTLLEIETRK